MMQLYEHGPWISDHGWKYEYLGNVGYLMRIESGHDLLSYAINIRESSDCLGEMVGNQSGMKS